MSNLEVFKFDGVDVVDSRQVAEMTGKQHKYLIRDIKSYCDILSKTTDPKIGAVLSPKLDPVTFSSRVRTKTAPGGHFPATF